ncbi:hypothetical protein MMC25_003462 [Agyrium rufum]|nr:hypothetical protein [Agyrium rufum]
MARKITIAAAQVGAVHKWSDRKETMARLITLLDEASSKGAQVVLFPEVALTTFFPRYLFTSQEELDTFFEHGDDITQSPNTKLLFDRAHELGIDISLGFAERTSEGTGYNASVYYSAKAGKVLSKYRKIHLPGTKEPFEGKDAINQLEKRYFQPGNLGFNAFRAPGLLSNALKAAKGLTNGAVSEEAMTSIGQGDPILGMMICNDRRWPEAWRSYGLQGVELILCGYNTNGYAPDLWGSNKNQTVEEATKDALFHHRLSMQSNSYMNSCFSVCAARCGWDDDKYSLIAGSSIVSPEGYILAEAKTDADELIVAEIDLAECRQGKTKTFDFARHRRVETYGLIVEQTGVEEPALLPAST